MSGRMLTMPSVTCRADAARAEQDKLVDSPPIAGPSFQALEDPALADVTQNAEKLLDAVVKVCPSMDQMPPNLGPWDRLLLLQQ